jgi:hypothetical protein
MGKKKQIEKSDFWTPIQKKVEWASRLRGWKKGLLLTAFAFLFLFIFAIVTSNPVEAKKAVEKIKLNML